MPEISSPTSHRQAEQPYTISEHFADYVSTFDLARVPAEVIARAKFNILDAIGIGYASVGYDFAERSAQALHDIGGQGNFPVIGMSLRLPQRDAAQLNGILIHGLDYDDTHSRAVIHPSASSVPTMLAAGTATDASGKAALSGFIIASELASRIGIAANGGFHDKGFHPTGVVGAFGSTLGAGYLYGLTRDQLRNAQGIVLSQAAGSLEFLDDGAWTKRNHPAWASVCGQTAAVMAKHGFVGPNKPYEGRYGIYQLHMKDDDLADLDGIVEGLGESWELMNIAFKPYPACHYTHAFADAILALKKSHGLDATSIKSITARIGERQVPVVCEPQATKKRPQNSYDAQFSVQYVIAASLLRGRFTLAELDEKAISDPEILDLCAKISYEIDPDSAYPRYYSGEVLVETLDGSILRHREHINRGSADKPLSTEELESKFMDNAMRAISREQAERVRDLILTLDKQTELATLSEALPCP